MLGGECAGHALCDAQRFEPWEAQTWEQLPSMTSPRIKAAAVESQGFLYAIGGLDGVNALSSVERFDMKSGTWQDVAPMHKPRYAAVARALGDGRLLIFGGELTEDGAAASMEVYDPEEDSWQLLPTVRSPLCGSAWVLKESCDAVISLGGLGLSGQALAFAEQGSLGVALEDQPDAAGPPRGRAVWSPLPSMLTARHQISACSFQGGAVAVGGKDITSEATCSVELLNSAGCWEELPPLPFPRLRTAVVAGYL